ncbi:DUF4168 domain-containing protein [Microbulbifer sp. HZ11]|uniref:DUF4168 domain-containing protein n=1 Tax=unclassified Microbulbifer TaxID=2619833 RepID=UPI0005B809CB|nr:DUF4168 domain-containing protein [Microbulbifer sp. HZ11]
MNMQTPKKNRLAITLSATATSTLLALGLISGSAWASQDTQQEAKEAHTYSATPQSSINAEDLPDEKLEAFARAQENVDETRVEMTTKLQNTQDPQEAMALREQANKEMLAQVEEAGLTRQEYNTIARAVAMNPDIAKKIDDYR